MTDEGFFGDTGAPAAPLYCSACSNALTERWRADEKQNRLVCDGCGRVQYRNPTVVAGVLPERDGRVLLLRRAYAPRAGTWVFPGGFVELGETAEQAALRECLEEVAVAVKLHALLGVYSRPGPGVVVVVYRGVPEGEPRAAHEAAEISWFTADQIPWGELAFDTTEAALRDWTAGVVGVQLPADSRSDRQVRKRRSSSS